MTERDHAHNHHADSGADMCKDCSYTEGSKIPSCCNRICDHSKQEADLKKGKLTTNIVVNALACRDPSRSIKNALDENDLTLHIVNQHGTHLYKYSGGIIGNLANNTPSQARAAHKLKVIDNDHDVDCDSDSHKNNLKCITMGLSSDPNFINELNMSKPHELGSGSLALVDCKDNVIGGASVSQHIHPGYYDYKKPHVLRQVAKHVQNSMKKYACFLSQNDEHDHDSDHGHDHQK